MYGVGGNPGHEIGPEHVGDDKRVPGLVRPVEQHPPPYRLAPAHPIASLPPATRASLRRIRPEHSRLCAIAPDGFVKLTGFTPKSR